MALEGGRRRREAVLAAMVAAEIAVFAVLGTNFFSAANGWEIVRQGVELGLLALALTPVIVTGGIDLSVGSMMGLVAVVFGKLWRDAGWPPELAAAGALAAGALGGGLNAVLIARFGLPPLIVTLGSYSLFRGLAEGLTGGADYFSRFPGGFLYLGQGYLGGVLPPQTLVLAAAAVFYWWLLHRSVIGRGLYAIGCSPEAARFGAVPVGRRLGLVYILSGAVSGLAALIYVAHLGQAKSDAGTGYELAAITAVVLGGTSIFGGEGTIGGTLTGLLALVVLQNGLRLAALPSELSGVLTGLLLVATIALEGVPERVPEARRKRVWLWGAAALVLVLGAVWAGRTAPENRSGPVIAVMPKAKGDPYFVSCRAGAEQAARELKARLIWDGPTEMDPAKQNEVVEGWITRRVDAIAVAVANSTAISTVLRKARSRGIPVLTWDADAEPDARDFFVNQATAQGIGETLADETARVLGGRGRFAIITGALSAANQNEWIGFIKRRMESRYPGVALAAVRPCDDDRDKAFAETQTLLKVYPDVRVIVGVSAPAVPGAAEAVRQSGRRDVKVIGLSLPAMCKPYVHAGVIDSVVLWNTHDLGYLTVYAADAAARGRLRPGARSLEAGRLGRIRVDGSAVILGAPFVFNAGNIDRYDF